MPIGRDNWRETVLPQARRRSSSELVAAGIRVTLDERDERPGWKFAEWELRGVPLRLEIGPKDIEKSQVLVARRDTREKQSVPMDGLAGARPRAARRDSADAARARASRSATSTRSASTTYDAFKQAMEGRPGFVIAPWCGVGRLRGADQDRHAGDDSQHADGRGRAGGPLRPLRQPRAAPRRGSRRATEWQAFRSSQRSGQRFSIFFIDRVTPRQLLALDDRAERVGQMIAPPARRVGLAHARAAAIASRHDASPMSRERRQEFHRQRRRALRAIRADRRAPGGCRAPPAPRARRPARASSRTRCARRLLRFALANPFDQARAGRAAARVCRAQRHCAPELFRIVDGRPPAHSRSATSVAATALDVAAAGARMLALRVAARAPATAARARPARDPRAPRSAASRTGVRRRGVERAWRSADPSRRRRVSAQEPRGEPAAATPMPCRPDRRAPRSAASMRAGIADALRARAAPRSAPAPARRHRSASAISRTTARAPITVSRATAASRARHRPSARSSMSASDDRARVARSG